MIWFMVMQVVSTLLEWVNLGRRTDEEKDLEILVLRRQLAILERKQDKPLRISRAEKLTLAILASQLKSVTNRSTNQLREVMRIFQPETFFKWHRELVRRKWTYRRKQQGGRPRKSEELERLVVRLGRNACAGKIMTGGMVGLRENARSWDTRSVKKLLETS